MINVQLFADTTLCGVISEWKLKEVEMESNDWRNDVGPE